jgi:hypothetical protein
MGANGGAGTATIVEHMRSPPPPSFVLGFYLYVLRIVVCPFILFLLVIVLSILLLFTDSDYPFRIAKPFLYLLVRLKTFNIALIVIKQTCRCIIML